MKICNFDPAFWYYEGAQAKTGVYYPRNELNLVRRAYTAARLSSGSVWRISQPEKIWQIFCLKLLLDFLDVGFAYSVNNILSYPKITNLPMYVTLYYTCRRRKSFLGSVSPSILLLHGVIWIWLFCFPAGHFS